MRIEPFQTSQAAAVSEIVRRNLLEVNSWDYPEDMIQRYVDYFSPDRIIDRATSGHTFVALHRDQVVGTASLGWSDSAEKPDYYVLTVFVMPEFHGQGLGKRLMEAVEYKARELGATKITVPSSITAKDFYRKLGFDFKDGVEELNENGNYVMEKQLVIN